MKASFSLKNYSFNKVIIDISNKESDNISIKFDPKGAFNQKENSFELMLVFNAYCTEINKPVISMECTAIFVFDKNITFDEIPNHFFPNSIAIIFPFVRAFVSSVTLQANINPFILLPVYNLTSLEKPLRDNTKVI